MRTLVLALVSSIANDTCIPAIVMLQLHSALTPLQLCWKFLEGVSLNSLYCKNDGVLQCAEVYKDVP
jgi:hypothetical protein